MLSSPAYAVVLIAHILGGIIGFGALGATGAHARLIRRSRDPLHHPALVRFFRPSPNIAARTVLVVPVLGAILLSMQHPSDVTMPYPWIGLALWTAALGLATAVIWPNERSIQAVFGAEAPGEAAELMLRGCARRIEWAGAATTVLFIAAFVIMIVQPS